MKRIDALRDQFTTTYRFFYSEEIVHGLREFSKNNIIIANMTMRLAEKERLLVSMQSSRSWRFTASFRQVMALCKLIRKTLSRSLEWILNGIYTKLPISITKKQQLKHYFFTVFKFFCQGMPSYRKYLEARKIPTICIKPDLSINISPDPNQVLNKLDKNPLEFNPPGNTKISIIIPVYNKMEYTYQCLKSIRDHSDREDYEIIVVDDCSYDRTPEMLARIRGIRVLKTEANRGFIQSCNLGARHARGEYLVFLNNDTLVRPRWLEWLLRTFEIAPQAGLVGAKLVYPDGRLQEAGGLIQRDGSGCNCGRMGDPEHPAWNYLREVDYCSGACLMIPRQLFISLGLFDDRYSPAYYEDVDLAFRVRASGRKVLYQPQACVVHFEGITAGMDMSRGIKQYQAINQQKFLARWEKELANCPRKEPGTALSRDPKKKILIIDESICLPDQNAGSLRMFNLIKILQGMGHNISFYPNNLFYPQPYLAEMQGRGIEVLVANHIGSIERYLRQNGKSFEIVMISRFKVAHKYINLVRKTCPNAKLIFDTVDLHFLRERREAELKKDAVLMRAAERTKTLELAVATKSDLTIVVSAAEKEIIAAERPGLPVRVVSTIQEIYGCKKPFEEREGLLFIGGFRHTPNIDAVVFLVREILPLLRGRLGDSKTYIIGGNPPPEILSLASRDVIVTGYVPDVEPYFNACRLSVAPLLWGAGVKGKINLSMSYGLPVVATPVAVEGMLLSEGEDVLTASDAKTFADAVARLYHDEMLWKRLSVNGIENVKQHFSFEAAKKAVESMLEEIDA